MPASRGGATTPPPQGRSTPPDAAPGRAAARRQRRAARPRRPAARGSGCAGSGLLLLLWVVYLVAVPLYAWTKVEKVEFEPNGDRPDDQPGTTYLMVGSDSRAGLSKEERKELGTGNAAGQRTDTIMLLHTGCGPEPADVDPPRLARRDPRARHHQDQRRLRATAARSCW